MMRWYPVIIKLRVPTGHVEIKDFLELVTLARWPFLIDGESWPAWKCAFLLLFTDSRRLDTSRRQHKNDYLFFGDSEIGIVRAFSQSPDGKILFVNSWILNIEFFTLSSHWQMKSMMFCNIYSRLSTIRKSREEWQSWAQRNFRFSSFYHWLVNLRKREREKEKKDYDSRFCNKRKILNNLLLHAGRPFILSYKCYKDAPIICIRTVHGMRVEVASRRLDRLYRISIKKHFIFILNPVFI